VPIIWKIAIGDGHRLLEIERALHGANGAGELDQHAVPHDLNNAPIVLRNHGLEDVAPPGLKGCKRTLLINAHQPAVADHICG
jgi:hypothetical protein